MGFVFGWFVFHKGLYLNKNLNVGDCNTLHSIWCSGQVLDDKRDAISSTCQAPSWIQLPDPNQQLETTEYNRKCEEAWHMTLLSNNKQLR